MVRLALLTIPLAIWTTAADAQTNADRFSMTHVFGCNCGYVGAEPKPRIEIEAWIEARDTARIEGWLFNNDLMQQAYGAEAVIRLQASGVIFSERVLDQVDSLRRSDAPIMVCSGCLFHEASLKEALRPGGLENHIPFQR